MTIFVTQVTFWAVCDNFGHHAEPIGLAETRAVAGFGVLAWRLQAGLPSRDSPATSQRYIHMNDVTQKATKNRVSNEQLLAAIMAQTAAIQGLVVALTPKDQKPAATVPTVTPPVEHKPVKFAHSVATVAKRTIGSLPHATEIPAGINVAWIPGFERKAAAWAANNRVTEPVYVYFVVNSLGKPSLMFGRHSSAASQAAVSIYKKVN